MSAWLCRKKIGLLYPTQASNHKMPLAVHMKIQAQTTFDWLCNPSSQTNALFFTSYISKTTRYFAHDSLIQHEWHWKYGVQRQLHLMLHLRLGYCRMLTWRLLSFFEWIWFYFRQVKRKIPLSLSLFFFLFCTIIYDLENSLIPFLFPFCLYHGS